MATVHDVAAYILERCEAPISTMKLQKLVYYSQAWHIAWEERPLFREPIEAWRNGPVCPALFRRHKGKFEVSEWDGDPSILDEGEAESVDMVLKAYGSYSGTWLGAQTHSEPPWLDARGSLPSDAPCQVEITPEAMRDYFQSIAPLPS